MEQIHKIIENDSLTVENSSFSIFVNILGKLLKRFVQLDLKNQIQKVIGRIFTKFSESKLYALNELGIHNLLSLFLTLAETIELKQVVSIPIYFQSLYEIYHINFSFFYQGQRLHNILLQIRLEKLLPSRQTCLTKGHIAMLILHSNANIDIHGYIFRFLEQIHALTADENKLPTLKIIIDGAEKLFQKENIFELGEYLLLGKLRKNYIPKLGN